jgi:hypothetical protein
MMIPIWLMVLVASLLPLIVTFLWAAFVREGGGSYDFGLDVWLFVFLSIIFSLATWVVYGLAA